jgi:DNA replication and repair protein RecF
VRLAWIELRDFRNHRETRLDIPDGLVVAVGGNGEGKTNLLEAMYYLLALSSPRSATDLPLIRHGVNEGYVRGEVEHAAGRTLIEVEIRSAGANRVQVNRQVVRRRRDVRRQVRAVFFGPHDLRVVMGDPEARRGFMDEAVVTLWPLREGESRAYDKALRQRNRLLKEWEGRGAPPELDAWDAELVQTGSAVLRSRAEAIERVGPGANEEFGELAGYPLEVEYRPSVWGDPLEEAFRDRLQERRGDELVRRTTLVGPHRDELDLSVRDLRARGFASHGEAWAAALALRLGLAEAAAAEMGERPVLLLDDPFSALDPERQRRISDRLHDRGQTVISVADETHVPKDPAAVWEIEKGEVTVGEAR